MIKKFSHNHKTVKNIFKKHLFEINLRLKYCFFSFLLVFFTMYYFKTEMIYIFTKPFLFYSKYFIFTDLNEAFYTSVQINLFGSLYIVLPIFLYQFWCFVIPSKFKTEKKKFQIVILSFLSLILFSVILTYWIVLPKLFFFLINCKINTNLLNIQLEARIKSYTEIVYQVYFIVLCFFQLPVIFFFLIQYNFITITFLIQSRKKIFLFFLFFLSLVLPPDILTQIGITFFFTIFIEFFFFLSFLYKNITML